MLKRCSLSAITAIIFLSCAGLSLAQSGSKSGQQAEKKNRLDLHAGYLAPKGADAGMLFGAAYTSPFDDAIDLGFGMDIFQKTYADEVCIKKIIKYKHRQE